MLEIDKFKAYDEKVIEESNQPFCINWSAIKDKLIRLAAKYTDDYASDIIIDINSVQKDIDGYGRESGNKTWLFGFRECGVDHTEYVLSTDERELDSRYRSIWRLDLVRDEEYIELLYISLRFYKVSYRN